ncbi:MAG TPA: DUF6152 family protein [Azospirillum sp.]|nr:DUF6152 family protein [Azospirillum sp.]
MPIAPPFRTAAITSILFAAGLGTAWAHHGWGGYDSTRLVTLEGKLESVSFQSPHVSARLPAGGKTWLLVLAPPARMSNRGLPEGSLAAGQPVRLEGYVHKSVPNEFRAERIVVGSQTVELR